MTNKPAPTDDYPRFFCIKILLQDGNPIGLEVNARADDTHYNLKNGGRSLSIVEASPDDIGHYTCVAANIAGKGLFIYYHC